MRRIVYALTSLLLFGSNVSCGHSSPTFTLDALFDSHQRKIIHQAADEWNLILKDPIDFNEGDPTTAHGQWRIVLVAPDVWTPFDAQCNSSSDKNGWARTIRIKPGVAENPDSLFMLIKHEIGHSVGMNHIDIDPDGTYHDERRGVMNHFYGETKFSQYDMSMCRSYGLCFRND